MSRHCSSAPEHRVPALSRRNPRKRCEVGCLQLLGRTAAWIYVSLPGSWLCGRGHHERPLGNSCEKQERHYFLASNVIRAVQFLGKNLILADSSEQTLVGAVCGWCQRHWQRAGRDVHNNPKLRWTRLGLHDGLPRLAVCWIIIFSWISTSQLGRSLPAGCSSSYLLLNTFIYFLFVFLCGESAGAGQFICDLIWDILAAWESKFILSADRSK